MIRRLPLIRTVFTALLLLAAPALLFGQPIGKGSGSGSTYRWEVLLRDYDKIVLNVATPDEDNWSTSFVYGKEVSFNLADLPGDVVVDGDYKYELRQIPRVSDTTKKALAKARATGDGREARKIMIDAGIYNLPTQSGSFRVERGAIVPAEEEKGQATFSPTTDGTGASGSTGSFRGPTGRFEPAVEDFVIADDLIVQGSACVGLDCVNNESFGFDTIRLKENNLRIKAEDTSVGTFPTNDWQLTFNDSASGGTSKFSVDDITGSKTPMTIVAGATTNSIFVDSTGRVGFRTSTPVLDLHVNTSNTPALRLEQNNSGGFTAQTWDIGANEANFFVRDVTGGSRLSFRIRPGAPTSSIDISADGDVGIGTASPAQQLDVAGGNIQLDIGSFILWDGSWGIIQQSATNNLEFVQGTARMAITTAGNVGINTTSPSSKLHVNGGDIRVSGGSFIDDGVTLNVPDYVFEDSYKLMPIPELAKFVRDQKHLPNVPSAKQIAGGGLNMSQFQMRLLEKVEELTLHTIDQHDKIGALERQNETLVRQNDELKARLDAIEKMIKQQ